MHNCLTVQDHAHACIGRTHRSICRRAHLFKISVDLANHFREEQRLNCTVDRRGLVEALVCVRSIGLVARQQRGLGIRLLDVLHDGHALVDNDVAILERWHLTARIDREHLI